MTFHHSAEDVRLDGHILKAKLQNADGEWIDSEFDLNNHLGNDNGNFCWDGEGFAHSAENIRFEIEGEAAVLRATLFDAEGNGEERDVNLTERINNDNGHFVYN